SNDVAGYRAIRRPPARLAARAWASADAEEALDSDHGVPGAGAEAEAEPAAAGDQFDLRQVRPADIGGGRARDADLLRPGLVAHRLAQGGRVAAGEWPEPDDDPAPAVVVDADRVGIGVQDRAPEAVEGDTEADRRADGARAGAVRGQLDGLGLR